MAIIFQTTYSNAFSWTKVYNKDFNEVCSQGSIKQYPSIGSDHGLALTRQQAIIWTNDGRFSDAYICHSVS